MRFFIIGDQKIMDFIYFSNYSSDNIILYELRIYSN